MNSIHEHTSDSHELSTPEPEGGKAISTNLKERLKKGTVKYPIGAYITALKIADFLVIIFAGLSGHILRFGFESTFTTTDHSPVYFTAIVTVGAIHIANGYRTRAMYSTSAQIEALISGSIVALFAILLFGFLSGTMREYSRIWLTSSFLIGFVLLLINRKIVTLALHRASGKDKLTETIVIVGATEQAEKILYAVRREEHSNINVLGLFDDRTTRQLSTHLKSQLLGSTTDLLDYLRNNHVDRVVVTLPWIASQRINTIFKRLRTVPIRIDLVPNDIVWQFQNINMEKIAGVPILTIANSRVEKQIGLIKRLEDILISAMIISLIWPILLFIALAIKLDSPGPVIFRQRRHGYNNQIFEVYKFRTMIANATNGAEIKQATRNDSRITKIGGFLRRTSLDELPQLFNVLRGNMSIVGPRPHAVQHNNEYGSIISEYFARHNVKPGITGWAQVNGLRGETDTIEKMHKRVDADLYYIEHWSLLLDLKVILRTAVTVWFQDTAY